MSRLARLQRGVVHRSQLAAAGVGRGGVARRVAKGWLHPLHRDVLLVGRPAGERLAPEMAAVLQFAGRGVLSHRTSAYMLGLLDRAAADVAVDVTVLALHGRSWGELCVHRVEALHVDDIDWRNGLPVTSAARTISDLAGAPTVSLLELETALARHRSQSRTADDGIRAAMARVPRRRGYARLRALLDAPTAAMTRSEAERAFLSLVRRARLSQPDVNARVNGHEVDFLFAEERVIVEIDGFAFHGDRGAFERDRARDQTLVAAGYVVLRFTWRQLRDEPLLVISRLAAVLTIRAATAA